MVTIAEASQIVWIIIFYDIAFLMTIENISKSKIFPLHFPSACTIIRRVGLPLAAYIVSRYDRSAAMRVQRIYIETTLFNFYFDTDREAHADTVKLFRDIATKKYEAYTSDYVIEELEKAPKEKRDKMIGLLEQYDITVLMLNIEAERLADMYVKQGIIPIKYRTDGVHIAVATVNSLDMVISLNFQHIVRRKTKIGTGNINALNGYRPVEIYTPMEVNESEND